MAAFVPIADLGVAGDRVRVSDAEIFLWPLFGFLVLAAAGASWQASNPEREIEAKDKILAQDGMLPRWRQMPLWGRLRAQQQDVSRLAKSAARRSKIFATLAVITLAYPLLFD